MRRAPSLLLPISPILIFLGIFLLFAAGRADAEAEQVALDNVGCTMGELLDIEGDYSDCPDEEYGGSGGKKFFGWTALLLGLGTGAVGAVLAVRTGTSDEPSSTDQGVTESANASATPSKTTDQISNSSAGPAAPITPDSSPRTEAIPEPSPVVTDIPRRACPECGEMIATTARLCRYCHSKIDPVSNA
ncbi:zinc ribbon domain-containing protein [Janibacter cremeus]|uniref:Uncharacterized protein n=1 Tax=Janibacter cremeus TaxID=1285192 RepID=A0A852W241_9MICO|nr:zinc ribbon domain-containing protein [Janibacter cremeus]NYF99681.1 hypothetical protein [Janibacter cremeus]